MVRAVPTNLYRAADVRDLDRYAIEELGILGFTLMSRAGAAALRELRARWPRARRLLVLCGAGNNGGDGYLLARVAQAAGLRVTTVALADPARLRGDAAIAHEAFVAAGGAVTIFDQALLAGADVIVDAILGTGLKRPLEGRLRAVVEAVNASGVPVIALDIPSGLDADTGAVMGSAVRARMTVTFVAPKLGLYTGDAPDHTGEIRFDRLGLPDSVRARLPVAARRIDETYAAQALGPRPRTAHKGDFGHVLVVGGDAGMGGAAALCALGALRAGAGRVTVATHVAHAPALTAAQPELMCTPVAGPADLAALFERVDVVALGPGLGTRDWGTALYMAAQATDLPLVVDADALNLLAARPQPRRGRILTPHPGEAARLLGASAQAVQADRFAALEALGRRYGGVVVLKGAATLIGDGDGPPWLCDRGNPGMAAPGMGDVLTGVIAAFVAQGMTHALAACLGVFVHASAGDSAASDGERGLSARDVVASLRGAVNPGSS